jgi:hypothetical protein
MTGGLGLLVGVILGSQPLWAPTPPGTPQRLELKKAFEFKKKKPTAGGFAVLAPQADRIFYPEVRTLQLIMVPTGKIAAQADYSRLPCADTLGEWWPKVEVTLLPARQQILVEYCYSLFLADWSSLEILRQIPVGEEGEQILRVNVLPGEQRVAVVVFKNYEIPGPKRHVQRIVILDTETWTELDSWVRDPDSRGFTVSPDGRLLVEAREPTEFTCAIQVRELNSRKLLAEWRFDRRGDPVDPGKRIGFCPTFASFIPGRKAELVVNLADGRLVIWNFEDGRITRVLRAPLSFGGLWLISPDGSFVIVNVSDDPQDSPEYYQEFIAWDLESGSVIYESPKLKWSFWDKLAFFSMGRIVLTRNFYKKAGVELNNFSADGRYLLASYYDRLIMYEVVRPAATQ